MPTRAGAIERAYQKMDSGEFLDDLARRIAIPTESQVPDRAPELLRYQTDEIAPSFEKMGFTCEIIENPVPKRGPILVAQRIENPNRPTSSASGSPPLFSERPSGSITEAVL